MNPEPWIAAFVLLGVFLIGYVSGVATVAYKHSKDEERIREWLRRGFNEWEDVA